MTHDDAARRFTSRTARLPAALVTPSRWTRRWSPGRANVEIASELFIETSTVKSHLGRAMAKIGTRDRLQTVVWAYQNGMVPY